MAKEWCGWAHFLWGQPAESASPVVNRLHISLREHQTVPNIVSNGALLGLTTASRPSPPKLQSLLGVYVHLWCLFFLIIILYFPTDVTQKPNAKTKDYTNQSLLSSEFTMRTAYCLWQGTDTYHAFSIQLAQYTNTYAIVRYQAKSSAPYCTCFFRKNSKHATPSPSS